MPSTSVVPAVIVVPGGAYFTAFSTRCSTTWRSRDGSARANRRTVTSTVTLWLRRSGRSPPTTSSRSAGDVDRDDLGSSVLERPDRGQDRVDQPVEPLDLVDRPVVPLVAGAPAGEVAALAADERRLLGQQVGVGADDRQRGPQLVGDHRDQLGPRLVERLERLDLGLGLALDPAFLDDPGEEVGDRRQLGDVGVAEVARLLGLDVEHPDDPLVPRQRDRQHRGDEPALVDPADPQEARIVADVGDPHRLARRPRPGRSPPRRTAPGRDRSGSGRVRWLRPG